MSNGGFELDSGLDELLDYLHSNSNLIELDSKLDELPHNLQLNPNLEDPIGDAGNEEKKLKGVRLRPSGKWAAMIRDPSKRKRVWLGSFETPQEAAKAYDKAAVSFRGDRVVLNFPHLWPEYTNIIQLVQIPGPLHEQIARQQHARSITFPFL